LVFLGHGGFGNSGEVGDGFSAQAKDAVDRAGNGAGIEAGEVYADSAMAGHAATFVVMRGRPGRVEVDGRNARRHCHGAL